MTGITDGKYHIRLAAGPSPLIGAEFIAGGGPFMPIVTDGRENIWTIEKLPDGKFIFSIGGHPGIPSFVQDDYGDVVANPGGHPTAWVIKGPDGGPYTIQLPGTRVPPPGWTVQSPSVPRSPVTVNSLHLPILPENQKWYILRIPHESS